jgi:PST family polysaccharide transporter
MSGGFNTVLPEEPLDAPGEPRIDPAIVDVRGHTARGTILTAGFNVGFALLGLVQRLVAAAFLTQAEFGLWAVILVIIVTLVWLKQVGVADKFIQQNETDQVVAFQKAFTIEFALSAGMFVLLVVVLPIYAVGYDNEEIILGGVIASLTVPITAFEACAWIPYRRLQYLRHRLLTAVNPLVTFLVTVALAIAGAGYWCFIIGAVAGATAGAVANVIACPYPLRLRMDRRTLREYTSFSLPLFGVGVAGLIVVQGSLLAANSSAGLAGIGAIGLAVGIAAFADRVDAIVSNTLYPAVCAITDKKDLMYEVFVKSNRVALIWGLPFGVGLALFADDLVRLLFGAQWADSAPLLAAIGLTSGIGQVAFNWGLFMRAVDDTRPLFVGALVDLGTFLVVSLPAILLLGLTGWVIGIAATMLGQLVIRAIYMRRLFGRFNIFAQFARAAAPVLPGAVLVLAARMAFGDDRSVGRVIAEVVVYVVVTVVLTAVFERSLIREVLGYLRRKRGLTRQAIA